MPRELGAAAAELGPTTDALGALSRLSARHQAVLCLHQVEGLGLGQVALVLGCSVGTVKSRLHRAREARRRGLEGMEVGS